jgi:hypothetical protein
MSKERSCKCAFFRSTERELIPKIMIKASPKGGLVLTEVFTAFSRVRKLAGLSCAGSVTSVSMF